MIERKFLQQNMKEHMVHEYISDKLKNVGHSHTKVVKTPLGEKVMIFASRPGLVVGRKGENIKKLTTALKKKFELENPQIEITEVANPNLNSQIIAERIASTLERFGPQRFKAVGHKVLQDVMGAGALGVEIKMKGIVPAGRKKTWRFSAGYMKKSGQIAVDGVDTAYAEAMLKRGVEGIEVRIMPPDLVLPDKISVLSEENAKTVVEKVEEKPKKKAKRKTTKKKTTKKAEEKPAEEPKVEEKAPEAKAETVEEAKQETTETPTAEKLVEEVAEATEESQSTEETQE
jgi:small subunit ribosomal protein S3